MSHQHMEGQITKTAYEALIGICVDALPTEACGLLVRSRNATAIDLIVPIQNVHENPAQSFSFHPAEWTEAFFSMQKSRQQLVGFYHSHPESDAFPSLRDNKGFLPASELTYWIVSLKKNSHPVVQPYRRLRDKFHSIPLVLA